MTTGALGALPDELGTLLCSWRSCAFSRDKLRELPVAQPARLPSLAVLAAAAPAARRSCHAPGVGQLQGLITYLGLISGRSLRALPADVGALLAQAAAAPGPALDPGAGGHGCCCLMRALAGHMTVVVVPLFFNSSRRARQRPQPRGTGQTR